jgi:hypothetical protein
MHLVGYLYEDKNCCTECLNGHCILIQNHLICFSLSVCNKRTSAPRGMKNIKQYAFQKQVTCTPKWSIYL